MPERHNPWYMPFERELKRMSQEGVRARILYMGSKNSVKAAHPPKLPDFGGSVIKYSFLL